MIGGTDESREIVLNEVRAYCVDKLPLTVTSSAIELYATLCGVAGAIHRKYHMRIAIEPTILAFAFIMLFINLYAAIGIVALAVIVGSLRTIYVHTMYVNIARRAYLVADRNITRGDIARIVDDFPEMRVVIAMVVGDNMAKSEDFDLLHVTAKYSRDVRPDFIMVNNPTKMRIDIKGLFHERVKVPIELS